MSTRMKIFRRSEGMPARTRAGAALLITLLTLSLMVIIVVAFLATMGWELQASSRYYDNQKARAVATLGFDTALAQLRVAFGPWDAPYGKLDPSHSTFPGYELTPATNFYSISPGVLTSWNFTSVNATTNYPLFSVPTDGTTATVNLNAPGEDGVYPVLGSSTPLNIYWVNVLTNPRSTTASAANPIVGRYAFWIDDENAKIDVNTADGTYNTNLPPQQCGLGCGSPSAVSLQELQEGGTNISATCASNIVAVARTVGFNSPREILHVAGTSPDLYTNNVFNLTTMSRSPDFNIFGQPKIPLIPANYTNFPYGTGTPGFLYNCATLQPLRELFPSQTGYTALSTPQNVNTVMGVLTNTPMGDPYTVVNPSYPASSAVAYSSNYYAYTKWPLAFTQLLSSAMTFANPGPTQSLGDNNPWNNGKLIANYLAGTNATYAISGTKTVTWPPFPGSSASSYLGKYTARQIDSITMQIVDLAGKATSPDWGRLDGNYTRSSSYEQRGWLSGQLVNGVGRNPKLDKVLMNYTTQAGTTVNGTNSPPTISAKLYTELYFPSGFQGVSLFHKDIVYGSYFFGVRDQPNLMSCQDIGAMIKTVAGVDQLLTTGQPAPLPKVPQNTLSYYPQGNIASASLPDGTTNYLSYWGNNLLETDQGVDWEGNNPSQPDPDQVLAKQYHQNAPTNASGQYFGEGPVAGSVTPIFQMSPMVKPDNSLPTINDWSPGQYRTVSNVKSWAYRSMMSTNAAGGTIHITGGIAYLATLDSGRPSEPDPVPLEAIRGDQWNGTGVFDYTTYGFNRTGEPFWKVASPYTNVLNAVIPMAASLPVGANDSGLVNTTWIYAYVKDPLVNKFPGDWIESTNSSMPTTTMEAADAQVSQVNADKSTCAIYPETSSTQAQWADPQSFWLPTIDSCATSSDGSTESPQIPRTSRFPSTGYLQYLRTGIIPDDETVPYAQQHGTPFRLLNFNASTDVSQTIHGVSYPDWAMLDLFYVPSSLLGYGSPYETFAGRTTSVLTEATLGGNLYPTVLTYSNANVVNNMYRFGTYGGATCGRINPNGAVIYTTNANIPTPGITRTVPLRALLHGINVNQTQTGNYVSTLGANDFNAPVLTAGTGVDETSVASAIAEYLTTNTYGPGGKGPAPFRIPGEICNVPAIAALTAPVNATRNDLVRQIIGNVTTQSNTFSIWVEGQSILKTKGNTNYGQYETGDKITATVRYHFIVERDLDPGLDGVYGNAASPGADGVVGTLDDPMQGSTVNGANSYNPLMPAYTYRIIYSEEIR